MTPHVILGETGSFLLHGRPAEVAAGSVHDSSRCRPAVVPRGDSGRRPFLRAFLSALPDPATYRVRRNVGLWLGFLLALPIPILSLSSSSPAWIDAISLTAPFVWGAILGAAGRVAGLGEDRLQKVTSDATAAGVHHEADQVALRRAIASERAGRERQESLGRHMDDELRLAQNVHCSLMPEDISRPDLRVVTRMLPCSFVGGDYLQAVLPRPDLLYLCVGDVSGHGVSAALVVSRIHEVVRRLILEQREPAEFLGELNRATTRILEHTSFFLTFAVFRVDLAAERIDHAAAGHPAQVLLRRDGRSEELVTRNPLLGCGCADVRCRMRSGSTRYVAGDTLVLFTDGLFEVAARDGGELLGEEGLISMMQGLENRAPETVATDLLQRVSAFGRPGHFEDDACLMVARLGVPPTRSVA